MLAVRLTAWRSAATGTFAAGGTFSNLTWLVSARGNGDEGHGAVAEDDYDHVLRAESLYEGCSAAELGLAGPGAALLRAASGTLRSACRPEAEFCFNGQTGHEMPLWQTGFTAASHQPGLGPQAAYFTYLMSRMSRVPALSS